MLANMITRHKKKEIFRHESHRKLLIWLFSRETVNWLDYHEKINSDIRANLVPEDTSDTSGYSGSRVPRVLSVFPPFPSFFLSLLLSRSLVTNHQSIHRKHHVYQDPYSLIPSSAYSLTAQQA